MLHPENCLPVLDPHSLSCPLRPLVPAGRLPRLGSPHQPFVSRSPSPNTPPHTTYHTHTHTHTHNHTTEFVSVMLSDAVEQEFYQYKDEMQCADWNLAFFQFATAFRRTQILEHLDNKDTPESMRYGHFANLFDIGMFPASLDEQEKEVDVAEQRLRRRQTQVANFLGAAPGTVSSTSPTDSAISLSEASRGTMSSSVKLTAVSEGPTLPPPLPRNGNGGGAHGRSYGGAPGSAPSHTKRRRMTPSELRALRASNVTSGAKMSVQRKLDARAHLPPGPAAGNRTKMGKTKKKVEAPRIFGEATSGGRGGGGKRGLQVSATLDAGSTRTLRFAAQGRPSSVQRSKPQRPAALMPKRTVTGPRSRGHRRISRPSASPMRASRPPNASCKSKAGAAPQVYCRPIRRLLLRTAEIRGGGDGGNGDGDGDGGIRGGSGGGGGGGGGGGSSGGGDESFVSGIDTSQSFEQLRAPDPLPPWTNTVRTRRAPP